MSAVFLKILNLTWGASWLILAVIVLRLLLKKAPRWVSCLLWGLVAIRLICPVSIESALSLVPSGKVVPETADMQPRIDTGIAVINNTINPAMSVAYATSEEAGEHIMQNALSAAFCIWIVGMAVMMLYAFISYIAVRRKVSASIRLKDNIMLCDEVKTPFILGVIRPLIYVPSALEGEKMEMVCAHERAHISRRDHWWKPIGFALLSVYWFNPLCWLAYILLCRDIEAACDEKVIKDKDRDYMALYSQTLLELSVSGKIITACPLAFGETGVKSRIKGILNYKKPAFWIILIALIVCAVVAVCFLTNPKKDDAGMQAEGSDALDNMGIDYTYEDGVYVAKDRDGNKKSYRYKKELRGRTSGAERDGMFIVLTNDPDITYEKVSRSIFSSNSNDRLKDTVITGMHVLDENGEIFVSDEPDTDRENDEGPQEKLITEYMPAETIATDSKFWQPPVLSVTYAGNRYAATQGSYNWSYVDEQGEGHSVCADSAHPLDAIDRMSHIDLQKDTDTLEIHMTYSPVKLGYRYWEAGAEEKTVEYDKDYTALLSSNDSSGVSEDAIMKIPADTPLIIELYGEWEYGDSSYYFAILPKGKADAQLNYWMELDLPQGYNSSEYSEYYGYMGGSYILPQAYTAAYSDSVPREWLYSGCITGLPAANVQLVFNDKQEPVFDKHSHFYMDNHTMQEYIQTLAPVNGTDGRYILEFSEEHDLYTSAQIYELEQQGIKIGEDEKHSCYWVFWYVKEETDTYYMVSLAKNMFTQEQAEKIAASAEFL